MLLQTVLSFAEAAEASAVHTIGKSDPKLLCTCMTVDLCTACLSVPLCTELLVHLPAYKEVQNADSHSSHHC